MLDIHQGVVRASHLRSSATPNKSCRTGGSRLRLIVEHSGSQRFTPKPIEVLCCLRFRRSVLSIRHPESFSRIMGGASAGRSHAQTRAFIVPHVPKHRRRCAKRRSISWNQKTVRGTYSLLHEFQIQSDCVLGMPRRLPFQPAWCSFLREPT